MQKTEEAWKMAVYTEKKTYHTKAHMGMIDVTEDFQHAVEAVSYTHLDLTRIRAALVCEQSLYEVAQKLGLGQYLKLGRGEEAGGGRERISILADATEAVFAAVYLDLSLIHISGHRPEAGGRPAGPPHPGPDRGL